MRRFMIMLVTLIGSGLLAMADEGPDTLWTRNYGGEATDWGYDVEPTTDGGFVFAGQTNSFGAGSHDVYLVKVNALGDTLWTRTYGGVDNDGARAIRQTPDGGYIVLGSTRSYGAGVSDVYLLKVDEAGLYEWSRTFGGADQDYGRGLDLTDDGGFILVGITRSFGAGSTDVYLIKTESDGDTVWTRTIGTTLGEEGRAVQLTQDGGFILAGAGWRPGNQLADGYVVKTNSNGIPQWTRYYGGVDQDWFNAIDQTIDGGFVVTGQTFSFGVFGSLQLMKLAANGDSLWMRFWGGSGLEEAFAVQQTVEGGYVAGGYTTSLPGGENCYVIKTDADGDTLWTRVYGGSGNDRLWDVKQTADEQYLFAGESSSFGNGYQFYLIRTGRVPCQPVSDLVVKFNAGTTLHFTAFQRGDYAIYSTTDPNLNLAPGDPGWIVEATLTNQPAGPVSWSDPSAPVSYKRYAIVCVCPSRDISFP